MQNQIRTGRMLDVNALATSKTKVTLGFKCEPVLKMDLALEAERFGMSLSEYVEVLVARRHETGSESELKSVIEQLNRRLALYENDLLYKFFHKYKGQTIHIKDQMGKEIDLFIDQPHHIYFYLLNAVKFN